MMRRPLPGEDRRPSVTGVYPPIPTEDELTIAGLSDDGELIKGWVRTPAGKVWTPEDLLWLPPSATKATDIDRAGNVVDVLEMGDMAWVTAQLEKREKYLDYLRAKVRAGAYRLTAALAKFLGLPFDEDGAKLTPRTGTGTVAYKSAQELRAQFDRLNARINGPAADDRHMYGLCSCHSESGLPIIPGA